MAASEDQIPKSEFLSFVLESLIPGDVHSELPSAAQVLFSNLAILVEMEATFESFTKGYLNFCENRGVTDYKNSESILEFASMGKTSSIPFLRKVLELYYTSGEVLSRYPDFAGITFPNSRKMPQNDFQILEAVIKLSEKS